MLTTGLIVVVVVALGFDFTNGFHDAANAVATSLGSRSIRPGAALALAAAFNVAGALVSTGVAKTIFAQMVAVPTGRAGLVLIFSALIGAIVWNLTTWRLGLPSSSTHALVGGLVGAALASAQSVHWDNVVTKVVIPMVASPVIGFAIGFFLAAAVLWAFRRARPAPLHRRFRYAQWLSTGAMAYSHGTQDAQKTMGAITLTLVAGGRLHHFEVPLWVILAAAAAMGLGTLAGGWRIITTLASRVTPLDPPRAFAAQTSASAVLLVSAFAYAVPVSSTHTITASVAGSGATRRLSAVRWSLARQVVAAWLLTLPGAALTAAAVRALTGLVFG